MNIYWCKTTPPNVGDALNEWIWPKLIPEIGEVLPESTLFGIGSVLDDRVNSHGQTFVVGSGARSPEHGVKSRDDLHLLAVRGPLTAMAFGIEKSRSTIDPAALLAYHYVRPAFSALRIGLVPYFSSPHDFWRETAERMGLYFISPHENVLNFLNAISRCDFVISEAMHGAIISDALRVPWYPIRSNSIENEGKTNQFKWTDWCNSVDIDFEPADLPPIWPKKTDLLSSTKTWIKRIEIERAINKIIRGRVRYLSSDRTFSERTERLLSIIDDFRATSIRHSDLKRKVF